MLVGVMIYILRLQTSLVLLILNVEVGEAFVYFWVCENLEAITSFRDWKHFEMVKSGSMPSVVKFYFVQLILTTDQWLHLSNPIEFFANWQNWQ